MTKTKQRRRGESRRNNRGQFLILSVLIIIILMISFVSLLASTSVLRMSMNRTDFREVTQEVTLNFRSAVGAAMAEVSRSLDYKASISRYKNYTSLDEYPEAASSGYKSISDWQKTVLQRYPGLGLNLSATQPIFECKWNSSSGYSRASSNMSLDILVYGFYGWKSEITVELNVTILDLYPNRTNGKTEAFFFRLLKENDVPMTDLQEEATSLFYQHVESDEFTLSKGINLTYFGDGYYLAEFSMYSNSTIEGLNKIKNLIASLNDAYFKDDPQTKKTQLRNMIDEVIECYNARQLKEAYLNLTLNVRPKLVPGGVDSWVISTANTTEVLAWIDLVRSQLLPTVRVALQDFRGIVVSAVRTFAEEGGPTHKDNTGPITRNLNVSPNPTGGAPSVTLTGLIDDRTTGLSNITDAEYFVGAPGQSGTGRKLLPSDGFFDSPVEEVNARIDVSGWTAGSHTIYVHGQDKTGLWGGYSSITVTVTGLIEMYVDSIEWNLLPSYRFPFPGWRWYRLEAIVKIVDIYGNPVNRAWVYGHWNQQPLRAERSMTNRAGEARFLSDPFRGSRTFTFTVDDVTRTGYIYNSTLNKVTWRIWP